MGCLSDKLQFLLQISQCSRIVLFQRFQFALHLSLLFREFSQTIELLRTTTLLVFFSTSFGIGKLGRSLVDFGLQLLNGGLSLFVISLCLSVLLGRKGPEVIASANFFLVDESIVD